MSTTYNEYRRDHELGRVETQDELGDTSNVSVLVSELLKKLFLKSICWSLTMWAVSDLGTMWVPCKVTHAARGSLQSTLPCHFPWSLPRSCRTVAKQALWSLFGRQHEVTVQLETWHYQVSKTWHYSPKSCGKLWHLSVVSVTRKAEAGSCQRTND